MLKRIGVRVHFRDISEVRRIAKRLRQKVLRFQMKFRLNNEPHPWESLFHPDFITLQVMVLVENVKRMRMAAIRLNKLREAQK